MKYNHKSALSFVDAAKAEGKEVKTVTIQIDEIQRKLARSGDYVITLVAKETGQRYTAFERVWLAQNINVDDLEEGDELEVTFMINGNYKNFLKVTVLTPHTPQTVCTVTDIHGKTIASETYDDDGLPF